MLLDSIEGPDDLRDLSYADLDALAAEIRQVVIDTVNRFGGHLGSNLGVVELTIALHRVFRSPEDILLWDTGHQAYVHKIITGRRRSFENGLRQESGLSGYPSRAESNHDWIENSHASTALSWAHGLSTALASATESRRRVVAVIGDGAMTGGMAFEGLNNLGHSGRDCIIILNDNGRSYAPTVSKLSESLSRLRLNPAYVRQQERVERRLGGVPLLGRRLERAAQAAKAAVREMWEPTTFFEHLGVRYTGPFDGHDIEGLERALANAAELHGPQILHVLTQKGRGYAPAENDHVKRLHDTSEAKPGSYTAAFTEALVKEAEARPQVVAVTAAMPDSTGVLPFGERFPDRCFDVGIAEQHAVTAAAGMARGGLRPVVAVYSTFLSRAFDQVNLDVGLHQEPVVFCLDRAGITGDDGPSHHGVLDMVLLTKVPGMRVFAPSSYQELQQMLHDALDLEDGPVAIRWPKTEAPSVPDYEVGHGLGARKARQGADVCLVGVGKMFGFAMEAARLLEAGGIDATVWDPRCVHPLDDALVADASTHPAVVTIEDGLVSGGIGSSLSEQLRLRSHGRGPAVLTLGVPVAYVAHGKPDKILAELGLDPEGIAAATAELCRSST